MKLGLFLFEKERHWNWYCSRVPTAWAEDMGGFIVIDTDTGTPVAAILMSEWTASTCILSIIIEKPIALRHGLLEVAADFVFNKENRLKALIRVSSKNMRSLNFCKNAGFTEICKIKDGFDLLDDMVFLEIHREDCKYLNSVEEVA